MAVRYVKDFEFPAASGYTKSCETSPAKMAKQPMYAKGGAAKAPKGKGVMLIIDMGPTKRPMKKAEGGAISDAERRMLDEMAAEADATTGAERTMKRGEGSMSDAERRAMQRAAKKPAPSKKGSPYVPGTNIPASINYDEEQAIRAQRGYAKGGKITPDELKSQYAAGAKRASSMSADDRRKEILDQVETSGNYPRLDVLAKKMGGKIKYEDGGKDTSVSVKDIKSGKVKQSKDADYYREMEQAKRAKIMKKGGKVHDDEAMDKALIKKMVKPEARKTKFADGGAVKGQMPPAGMLARRPITQPGPMPDRSRGPITQPGPMGGVRGGMGIKGNMGGPGRPVLQSQPNGVRGMGDVVVTGNMGGPGRPVLMAGGAPQMAMKSGGNVKSPLQRMNASASTPTMARARNVPVGSREPMISAPSVEAAPVAAPRGGIGVGQSRPGKPNVGAIRAAMARAATTANPDSSPSMMKRGGMSKGKC